MRVACYNQSTYTFSWRILVKKFKFLDDAKKGLEDFIAAKPGFFENKKEEDKE